MGMEGARFFPDDRGVSEDVHIRRFIHNPQSFPAFWCRKISCGLPHMSETDLVEP